jgi:hypothetical protein
VDGLRFPTLGSLLIVREELSPTQPSVRSPTATAIMITCSNSPVLGSGIPNHYIGDLLHTIGISGRSRVSAWADGPRNLMKITSSRMHNKAGVSGEIEFAMEKLRPSACLIRSVRD